MLLLHARSWERDFNCPGKGHSGGQLASFFHIRKGDVGVKIWKMNMSSPGRALQKDGAACTKTQKQKRLSMLEE